VKIKDILNPLMMNQYGAASEAGKTLLLLTALTTGGYTAAKSYERAKESNKDRALLKAVDKQLLKHRMGAGRPFGPGTVQVDVDPEAMDPIYPGSKALVNPTSGRDYFSNL